MSKQKELFVNESSVQFQNSEHKSKNNEDVKSQVGSLVVQATPTKSKHPLDMVTPIRMQMHYQERMKEITETSNQMNYLNKKPLSYNPRYKVLGSQNDIYEYLKYNNPLTDQSNPTVTFRTPEKTQRKNRSYQESDFIILPKKDYLNIFNNITRNNNKTITQLPQQQKKLSKEELKDKYDVRPLRTQNDNQMKASQVLSNQNERSQLSPYNLHFKTKTPNRQKQDTNGLEDNQRSLSPPKTQSYTFIRQTCRVCKKQPNRIEKFQVKDQKPQRLAIYIEKTKLYSSVVVQLVAADKLVIAQNFKGTLQKNFNTNDLIQQNTFKFDCILTDKNRLREFINLELNQSNEVSRMIIIFGEKGSNKKHLLTEFIASQINQCCEYLPHQVVLGTQISLQIQLIEIPLLKFGETYDKKIEQAETNLINFAVQLDYSEQQNINVENKILLMKNARDEIIKSVYKKYIPTKNKAVLFSMEIIKLNQGVRTVEQYNIVKTNLMPSQNKKIDQSDIINSFQEVTTYQHTKSLLNQLQQALFENSKNLFYLFTINSNVSSYWSTNQTLQLARCLNRQ